MLFNYIWLPFAAVEHPAGLETDLFPHQLRPSCNAHLHSFDGVYCKIKTISSLFPMVAPKSLVIPMQYGRDRCCDVRSEF